MSPVSLGMLSTFCDISASLHGNKNTLHFQIPFYLLLGILLLEKSEYTVLKFYPVAVNGEEQQCNWS